MATESKPDPPAAGEEDGVVDSMDICSSIPDLVSSSSSSSSSSVSVSDLGRQLKHCNVKNDNKLEPSGCTDFDSTLTFSNYSSMKKFLLQWALDRGILLTDKPKAYIKEDRWNNLYPGVPFVPKTPSRGAFVCSPFTHGREKKSTCPMSIGYLLGAADGACYGFRKVVLTHSHPTGQSHMMVVEGTTYVNLERDLTPQEDMAIMHCSIARMSIPQISTLLCQLNPGRAYTSQLLHRLKKKHLDARLGEGRHGLDALFDKCRIIRQEGGVFEITPGEDFGIESMHVQSKIMKDLAFVYGDLRMVDGTFKLSKYEFCWIVWLVVDCLERSNIIGFTAHFTESSGAIMSGARLFFPQDEVKDHSETQISSLEGYFCPFGDNKVRLLPNETSVGADNTTSNANTTTTTTSTGPSDPPSDPPSLMDMEGGSDNTDGVPNEDDDAGSGLKDIVMLSDEGSGLILAGKELRWHHFHDRKHLTDKICLNWHGLSDKQMFKSDVHDILNCVNKDKLSTLIDTALAEHQAEKAQEFLKKISDNREKFCFAYSCEFFTAGHVGDTRSEGKFADIKGKGTLKALLAKSNFDGATTRILAVQRDTNLNVLKELSECRQLSSRVGTKYAADLVNSKAASVNFSNVVADPTSPSKFIVSEKVQSTECCHVDLQHKLLWMGQEYTIIKGTCSYFTSTLKICPVIV